MALLLASLIVTAGLFLLRSSFVIPRSVLVMDPIVLILVMGGSRFVYRALKEHQLYGLRASRGEPVIIIGEGQTAITLARELLQADAWRVVGLVDKD